MTNVYVVAHKAVNVGVYKLDFCYKVIRVGAYSKERNAPGIPDSQGDSIAEKNPNYCELTALYWIWKNDKISCIKGLCHYRRYFTKSKISPKSKYFLSSKDIDNTLQNYDAIVSRNENFSCGNYNQYLKCGYKQDLDITKDAIKTICPEYLFAYMDEVERGCGLYAFNMMIAPKKIFDSYCDWLFKIMEYVENRIDLSGYSQQEARVFGYLSERLLGVWIKKNQIRVKEYRVINTEEKKNLKYYIREFLKEIGIFNLFKKITFEVHRYFEKKN